MVEEDLWIEKEQLDTNVWIENKHDVAPWENRI